METISWQHFEQVDLRVGTIVTAEVFAEARLPAYILHVDFGPDIGVLKSSAYPWVGTRTHAPAAPELGFYQHPLPR